MNCKFYYKGLTVDPSVYEEIVGCTLFYRIIYISSHTKKSN